MTKKRYDVFKAIAAPARRQIIGQLLISGTLSISAIAADFKTTRQGITRHINVLQKAGLISIEDRGRERYCTAEFRPLKEVFDWVSFYMSFWDEKLNSLEAYMKQKQKANKHKK